MSDNEQTTESLKIQALLQRIGEITANYENAIADYRVELSNYRVLVDNLQRQYQSVERNDPPSDAPEALSGIVVGGEE